MFDDRGRDIAGIELHWTEATETRLWKELPRGARQYGAPGARLGLLFGVENHGGLPRPPIPERTANGGTDAAEAS